MRRADFLRVAATRKKWASPGLIVQIAPMPEEGLPARARIGFTASKKVGNAVARNRAKRRLRAVAAEILGGMAASGHDYVLIGRRETLVRPYSLLLKDAETALKRLGALDRPGNGPEGGAARDGS